MLRAAPRHSSLLCRLNRHSIPYILGIGVLFLGTTAYAQETSAPLRGSLSFSTGFDYSNGDYGKASDTEIWYVPFTGSYRNGPWRVKVTVPYISIEGPGGVVGGTDGGVVIGGKGGVVTRESGLGDVVASVSYLISPGSNLPFVELTGKVKFPTADEDDFLGTGEFDYTIQADVFQKFGNLTPFAMIGYRFRGDSSTFDLEDGFIASGGFDYKMQEQWNAGLLFDYREAATKTSDDREQLIPYINWKPVDDWSLNLYGVIGLSDGSPDAGVGLQIKYTVP